MDLLMEMSFSVHNLTHCQKTYNDGIEDGLEVATAFGIHKYKLI